MKTPLRFWSGTKEKVMLKYSTAKYDVFKWHTPERLNSFIQKINERKRFEKVYQ